MLNEILKNKYQLAIIGILVILLVCIRLFETKIFYDPFLDFFKTDFQNKELPDYESFKLFFNLLLRYFLNTAISIGILHVLFKDKNITKLSLVLFIFIFIVLITLFVIELNIKHEFKGNEVLDDKGNFIIKTNHKYFRPAEVDLLIGDSTKAAEKLLWKPKHTLETLVKDMIEADLKRYG